MREHEPGEGVGLALAEMREGACDPSPALTAFGHPLPQGERVGGLAMERVGGSIKGFILDALSAIGRQRLGQRSLSPLYQRLPLPQLHRPPSPLAGEGGSCAA